MKKEFLLIVVSALLVALGLAQTPAASSNTDQTNIRGAWVALTITTPLRKTTRARF